MIKETITKIPFQERTKIVFYIRMIRIFFQSWTERDLLQFIFLSLLNVFFFPSVMFLLFGFSMSNENLRIRIMLMKHRIIYETFINKNYLIKISSFNSMY